MKPLISVITVSYNSEKTIHETIESVLHQTYPFIEYTIIDGLSTDCTVEIAERYRAAFEEKNIAYKIVSEKDGGIYDAMNKGIGLSAGEIVGIINSDDYYNDDTLQKVADFFIKTGFDVMYGDLRIFGGKKEYIKKSKITRKFNTRFWNHPTTFVKRSVYDDVKYACESIYDDLDFMLAVRAKGYKIEVLSERLANFRLGGVSNKKSFKKMLEHVKTRNAIYKKYGCKGYKLGNFTMEFMKYILSK